MGGSCVSFTQPIGKKKKKAPLRTRAPARAPRPRFLRRAPVEREQQNGQLVIIIQFLPDVELFRAPTMVGLMDFTPRFYLTTPVLSLNPRRVQLISSQPFVYFADIFVKTSKQKLDGMPQEEPRLTPRLAAANGLCWRGS